MAINSVRILQSPVLTGMGHRDSYYFPFASFPAVRIMLLMAVGISIAEFFLLSVFAVAAIFITASVSWALFEFLLRNKLMVLSTHAAAVFYSILVLSASMVYVTFQNERLSNQIEKSRPILLYEWEELTIKGRIDNTGASSSGGNFYTVNVSQTSLPNGMVWKQPYKIRLYASGKDVLSAAGDYVDAKIRLYEFPEQRNPHEFDYGKWLNEQGITAHGELQQVIQIKTEGRWGWGVLRSGMMQNIEQLFDEENASLAKALLLGYKDDLPPDARQQFSRAGLSHIMAVSGLHVGFIIAPFWFFIPYMWGSKKGKWFGLLILTVLLILYAGLTGFSASVSRASLMAWLLTYGRLFYKVRNSVNLTAIAAIVLLLINPKQLFDAGFQLSFSAVFIILLAMPEARRLVPQKYHFGWRGGLITIILVSIVVQLGLFPILAGYFGEFSIAGPVSNALVIPLLTFVVPAGLILVIIASIAPQLSHITVIPLEYSLRWIGSVASFTGGSSVSFITIDELSPVIYFIWFFAILAVAFIRIPKIRWKMIICLLLSMNVYFIQKVIEKNQPNKLEITFLDVGQGDAIHIKTPNEKHLLVDAGRWTPGSNSGRDVILPYLEEVGVERLDAVLLSHPHADHVGGMPDIISKIQVDTIYQSDVEYDSRLYETYMNLAADKEIPVKYPKAGDLIHIDPSIRIFVLGPEGELFSSNPNNRSLVFKLMYDNTSVLFSGDAEKEQEQQIAERYRDFLKSDLYKVGHHGSNTSSTGSFIKFVEPDISVASLAFQNRFGHPGPETVSRLYQYSEVQNYTSLSGAVVVESDGQTFKKINWKD